MLVATFHRLQMGVSLCLVASLGCAEAVPEQRPLSGCESSAQCAQGQVCREGRCRRECQEPGDCPPGWTCQQGACLAQEDPAADAGLDLGPGLDAASPPGGDAEPDASNTDSGWADLEALDSAVPPDAGSDAGDDGGPELDASVDGGPAVDAGPLDQGPSVDQGPEDGGAMPDDSGPGAPDVEAPPDAAAPVDLAATEDQGAPVDQGIDDSGAVDSSAAPDLGGGPALCQRDADCPVPTVCRLLPDPADPFFSLPQCGPPVGATAAGQGCASDPECRSGTCLSAGLCYGACADGVGCGRNQRCEPVQLVLDDRGTPDPADDVVQELPACVPAAGEQCGVDGDCPAPQLCQPQVVDDGGGVALRCADPLGPLPGGSECVEDAACATGLCLQGYCYQACQAVDDCPAEWICGRLLLAVEGGPQPAFSACLPRPAECESDVDCGPDGTCLPYGDAPAGRLVGLCLGRRGDVPAGAPCVEGQDCRSGQCLEVSGGGPRCLGLCRTQADCAVGTRCYPDQLYLDLAPDAPAPLFDALPACTLDVGSGAECARDADCPGAEICLPVPDGARLSFRLQCRDPVSALGAGPGEGCFLDDLCASGSCVPVFGMAGFCLGVCASDLDCADGTVCAAELLRDGGFDPDSERDDLIAEVPLCVLPPL